MPRSADPAPRPGPECAVAVFAKAPLPGTVKTRLIPPLTPAQAARLHAAFVADTLRRVASLDVARFLACTPQPRHPFLSACGRRYHARTIAQGSGDLGARMQRVAARLLTRYPKVVIIGTDSPTLPIAYIENALRTLDWADIVFGPSEDGGYYLVGQRRLYPKMFQGIPWGGPDVLASSLDKIPRARVALLPPWYDVDRPRDLARLRTDVTETGDCPKTASWFRARQRGSRL
ncbi:MAG: TIGR04282 family arsenosugar biosynthesis glycosyltransferase [Nitrospirota bacterium]